MSETSRTSSPKSCGDSPNVTSSPALVDGHSPCDSQDGRTTDLFGREVAPASHSLLREKSVALKTNAIFGPPGFASFKSADLQRSLENRLRAALDTNGSPEFTLKWKRRLIRSGRWIYALRASRRSTLVSVSGLWRTPAARDWRGPLAYRESIRGSAEAASAKHGDVGIRARIRFQPDPDSIVRIDGLPRPVGEVRAFGNAIVPQIAAQFIESYMQVTEFPTTPIPDQVTS